MDRRKRPAAGEFPAVIKNPRPNPSEPLKKQKVNPELLNSYEEYCWEEIAAEFEKRTQQRLALRDACPENLREAADTIYFA